MFISGHCIKKFEPISSRTLTDFARARVAFFVKSNLVDRIGFEPMTSALQTRRSTN